MTGHGDIPMSVRAIKAGAADFLTKPVRADALVAAVRAAIDQERPRGRPRQTPRSSGGGWPCLTAREREVLEGIVAGRLNKQIAGDLGIVEQTVKFHRAHLMERMQARTVAELMMIAARLGIGTKNRRAGRARRIRESTDGLSPIADRLNQGPTTRSRVRAIASCQCQPVSGSPSSTTRRPCSRRSAVSCDWRTTRWPPTRPARSSWPHSTLSGPTA